MRNKPSFLHFSLYLNNKKFKKYIRKFLILKYQKTRTTEYISGFFQPPLSYKVSGDKICFLRNDSYTPSLYKDRRLFCRMSTSE